MSTIRDVAKHAGVAPITVSRVINDGHSVSPETRQRVQLAIAELDYIPNVLGTGLRSKRTQTLALLLSDITNPSNLSSQKTGRWLFAGANLAPFRDHVAQTKGALRGAGPAI